MGPGTVRRVGLLGPALAYAPDGSPAYNRRGAQRLDDGRSGALATWRLREERNRRAREFVEQIEAVVLQQGPETTTSVDTQGAGGSRFFGAMEEEEVIPEYGEEAQVSDLKRDAKGTQDTGKGKGVARPPSE